MHDPIVILGFFAATQMTFDLSVLAAVLAVIGYSINDTVVVFDRVRESVPQDAQGDAEEVMNAAINQTLSRTIMTSVSTLLVVVVLLYLFGGETLRGLLLRDHRRHHRRHVFLDLRRRRAGARHEASGAGPDASQEGRPPKLDAHAVSEASSAFMNWLIWLGFFAIFIGVLALDLGVLHRESQGHGRAAGARLDGRLDRSSRCRSPGSSTASTSITGSAGASATDAPRTAARRRSSS